MVQPAQGQKTSLPIASSMETQTRWVWFITRIIFGGLKRADQNFCAKSIFPIRRSKNKGFIFP